MHFGLDHNILQFILTSLTDAMSQYQVHFWRQLCNFFSPYVQLEHCSTSLQETTSTSALYYQGFAC